MAFTSVPMMVAAAGGAATDGGTARGVTPVRDARGFAAALPRRSSELVVISFVKAGCRACRYASAQFKRVAEDPAIGEAEARFFELDVANAPSLCEQLGVSSVPRFQVYALPQHCQVAGILDTVMGPHAVKQVRETVTLFAQDQLNLDDYDLQ